MSGTSAVRRELGASILVLVLRCAPGSSLSRVRTPTGEPSRRTCGGDGSVGHPAGSSANRAIIRTGPSAHHSPVGRFQLETSTYAVITRKGRVNALCDDGGWGAAP